MLRRFRSIDPEISRAELDDALEHLTSRELSVWRMNCIGIGAYHGLTLALPFYLFLVVFDAKISLWNGLVMLGGFSVLALVGKRAERKLIRDFVFSTSWYRRKHLDSAPTGTES